MPSMRHIILPDFGHSQIWQMAEHAIRYGTQGIHCVMPRNDEASLPRRAAFAGRGRDASLCSD